MNEVYIRDTVNHKLYIYDNVPSITPLNSLNEHLNTMVGQEKNLRTGVVVNINSYPGIDHNLRFAGNVIYMDGRGMGDTRILNDLDPGEELFVFYLADYFGDG